MASSKWRAHVKSGHRPPGWDADDWNIVVDLVREAERLEARPRACVVGAVRDVHGRLLLGRRLKPDDGYGQWVLPGGGIEGRETFEQALRRELREECGIELERGELLGVYRHLEGVTNNVVVLMAARIRSAEAPSSPSDELERPRFFSAKELARLDVTPTTRALLELAVRHKRGPEWTRETPA